jgi:putative transposase
MLGFKTAHSAAIILGGIELIHMIRKRQLIQTDSQNLSLAHQFNSLAA